MWRSSRERVPTAAGYIAANPGAILAVGSEMRFVDAGATWKITPRRDPSRMERDSNGQSGGEAVVATVLTKSSSGLVG